MPLQIGNQFRAAQPRARLPASSAAAERSSLLRGRSPSCSAFCRRLGLAFSVRSLLIDILFGRRTTTHVSPAPAAFPERYSTNHRIAPQRTQATAPANPPTRRIPALSWQARLTQEPEVAAKRETLEQSRLRQAELRISPARPAEEQQERRRPSFRRAEARCHVAPGQSPAAPRGRCEAVQREWSDVIRR